MAERFYVATDHQGVQHVGGQTTFWDLPSTDEHGFHVGGSGANKGVVLTRPDALLDELGELIFVAEPTGQIGAVDGDVVTVDSAVLSQQTPWGVVSSAIFALDCAEHAAGDLTGVELSDGTTIESVLVDPREVLRQFSADAEHRLGRLARLGAIRRLRRQGDAISDVARELMTDDISRDVDALEDPAYSATASIVDAVLAAVESVRHLALPRYTEGREHTSETTSDSEPSSMPTTFITAWGPIAIGAEHHNPYAPPWVTARDAASRARDAAVARSGEEAGAAERQWQAQRLEAILQGE